MGDARRPTLLFASLCSQRCFLPGSDGARAGAGVQAGAKSERARREWLDS